MNPEHQQYLPAVAKHAKEWISPIHEPVAPGYLSYEWTRGNLAGCYVRETELLQLMQWIEEREGLGECNTELGNNYFHELTARTGLVMRTHTATWFERWRAICEVKGWKEKS